jgi:ribonuclease HI
MFKIRSILNDFVQQNIPSPFRMLGNQTITILWALPKGAGTERIRTEMRQVMKYRLLAQTTIFNAEMFAILKTTEHSKHMHCKTVIMTDSLNTLTALERVYPGRNPTIPKILNLLAVEGEDLKLMWVPAHTGIEGNESTE